MPPPPSMMHVKGCLKKEGAPPKPKRKLGWKDGLIAAEPTRLSQPKRLTDTVANDLEQENFRQVWREVSNKKLVFAARTLQKFARKFMLCWILTNDRRTELYEELDYIEERLQGDLEWLKLEQEDMVQDAKLQVELEMENAPPEEVSAVALQLKDIKSMQAEIRSLKQENEKLRRDSKELKKENKQLGYDLKEKAPAVEMGKVKLQNIKDNNRKYQINHDQYPPNIQKWKDGIQKVEAQNYECKRQGIIYRNACLTILQEVKVRYPKKRLLNPIKEIMNEEFVKYYPVPGSDDEYQPPPPAPPKLDPPKPKPTENNVLDRQTSVGSINLEDKGSTHGKSPKKSPKKSKSSKKKSRKSSSKDVVIDDGNDVGLNGDDSVVLDEETMRSSLAILNQIAEDESASSLGANMDESTMSLSTPRGVGIDESKNMSTSSLDATDMDESTMSASVTQRDEDDEEEQPNNRRRSSGNKKEKKEKKSKKKSSKRESKSKESKKKDRRESEQEAIAEVEEENTESETEAEQAEPALTESAVSDMGVERKDEPAGEPATDPVEEPAVAITHAVVTDDEAANS